jgi:hypothetical protein
MSEQARIQKEADAKELESYLKIRDENIAQKEAEKEKRLAAGKKLQAFHLEQIVIILSFFTFLERSSR